MEKFICHIFILSTVISSGNQRPVLQTPEIDKSTVNFLTKFGYLNSAKSEHQSYLLDQESLITAVKQFQTFGGVTETGIIDGDTLELMRTPRCGLPDVNIEDGAARTRMKRFALQGSRWKKEKLTYSVGRYPSGLSRSEVDTDVKKAFNMWQQASGLSFVRKRSWDKVDIELRFENYYHGDEDAFDGPGGNTKNIQQTGLKQTYSKNQYYKLLFKGKLLTPSSLSMGATPTLTTRSTGP